MCDDDMRDHWQINGRVEELLVLLEGLVAGLRGARKKALDRVLPELRRNLKTLHDEHTAVHQQAYNGRHAVDGLERERRGLQKRIATLEAEHKAEIEKYKAALVDIAKDLINTPAEMAGEILGNRGKEGDNG